MLKDLLQSISTDSSDADGVAELVVTALGTSGRHYVCWKTRSGQYKQQSHGLPQRLQDWLFPADGTTRDFATLQVILIGDDGFRASDKNGDIRSSSSSDRSASDAARGHHQQLRRALTYSDDTTTTAAAAAAASSTRRRLSRTARELSLDGSERPRSSTLPTVLPASSHPTELLLKPSPPPPPHARSPSVDKLRRLSAVSLAFQFPKRKSLVRPPSIGHDGHEDLATLKEYPSPPHAAGGLPTPKISSFRTSFSHPCDCGCHAHGPRTPRARSTSIRRSTYSDASVQTEPPPEPEPEPESEPLEYVPRRRNYNSRYRDSSVSSAGSFGTDRSYPHSHRSSFDTTITRPDSCDVEDLWKLQPAFPPANPVVMGRMQDYFRSTTYVLGGALHPSGMG
ncbi:hypothetical protein F5Y15DRAFT_23820 [Xylariaceae sp. FL0016]|nr:hypothetical protein F5Y15DRAFT_23820 [Xylariaceae sp. FL0016]